MSASMGINWKVQEDMFREMETIFVAAGKNALTWNHYDLAANTGDRFTVDQWKSFLMDGRVSKYINTEFESIQSAELRKLIVNIGSNTKSVGHAQLISTLAKLMDNTGKPDDNKIFVYTYVPLNAQQEHASEVVQLEEDVFEWKEEEGADTSTLPT